MTLIMVAVATQMCGQTYDTIYNRSDELYYSEWYDTSLVFLDTGAPCCFFPRAPDGSLVKYIAISDYTPRPLKVRGLALMHTIDYNMYCMDRNGVQCTDTSRVPEHVRLYQWDGDSLRRLASARWDTATPQVLKLPRKQDTNRGFEYCYLYRVYFDTSVTVDSVFFIAGSVYNNYYVTPPYQHRPTFYVAIGRQGSWLFDAYMTYAKYHSLIYNCYDDEKEIWRNTHNPNFLNWYYGPFFAIAPDTSCLLELHSADSAMGSVHGGGWYLDSSYITVTAIPERGYRFTHWNDGDVSNPRTVFLTHDTSFTAYFEEAYYTLAATADPEWGGTVTGGGTYRGNDTATMAALPNEGYEFVSWHDSDTAQTRQLEVTHDTAFTAFFRSTQGFSSPNSDSPYFTLTPNPTQGSCLLETAEDLAADGNCWVTVADAQGREVLRLQVVSQKTIIAFDHFAAGVYMVTLSTSKGSMVKKLVVK